MLKSLTLKFILFYSILSLSYTFCIAQPTKGISDIYFSDYVSFSPANFYIDQRFEMARNLPKSFGIQIRKLSELEDIINHGITNNITGISLDTRDSLNFDKSVDLLNRFPNLQYLQIDDYSYNPNIRKNRLQFPESIKRLTQLKIIEFKGNNFLDMDDAISKISNLKNLTGLFYREYPGILPKQITNLEKIRLIKVSTENLQGLELGNVKWEYVNLVPPIRNKVNDEEIIKKLSTIKSLTDLTLKYYSIPSSEVISKFKNLHSLTISAPTVNSSANLFSNISALTSLQKLTVIGIENPAETIAGIEKLKNLKHLELKNIASFDQHPEQFESIGKLKSLQSLKLSGQSAIVSDFLGNLSSLKSLIISAHDVSKIMSSIFLLPSLEIFNLSSSPVTELPDLPEYGCKKLKELKLEFNQITILPNAIVGLRQLEVLNIKNNKLIKIPVNGWEQMTALKDVNLGSNQLIDFPNGLQLVKKLETLDLSNNQIGLFPEIQGEGYALKSLILTNNQLTQLPSNIGKLTKLEILLAGRNCLTSVPNSLGECKQIKQLKLNGNRIDQLPDGLKDTKNLELLDVAENASIDPGSVFNVLLFMPRKHLLVDMSKINLQSIPATEAWKDVSFAKLNLNGNKLTTLPVQFAQMKDYNELTLNNNPFGIDPFICNRPIKNKSDIKILYDELGIELQNNPVTNAEYAEALAERVSDYYWNKKYDRAIAYANKAVLIDSVAYGNRVPWDEIGTSRLKTGDYRGAINDFNQFIIKESKTNFHWGPSIDQVERGKSEAHQALGEKDKAIETHIYFAKKHNNINSYANAYVMFKELGNDKRAKELMDTLILSYQNRVLSNEKYKNPFDPTFIVEYAEVLIITEQPVKAIDLLNSYDDKLFYKHYLPIKYYLLNTARYLKGELTYEQAEKDLINRKSTAGKVSSWSFDLFNNWMKTSIKSEQKKTQLLALQKAAEM